MKRCEYCHVCPRPGRWRVDVVIRHPSGIRGATTYHVCGMHLHRFLADRADIIGVRFEVTPEVEHA